MGLTNTSSHLQVLRGARGIDEGHLAKSARRATLDELTDWSCGPTRSSASDPKAADPWPTALSWYSVAGLAGWSRHGGCTAGWTLRTGLS
jgi:hypothetical protein